jgi:glycosyltransferase involved in cell wall biosynthesis
VQVSVIIPTHNPHPGRLRRTLAGVRAQTLPITQWETLLVDNASQPEVDPRVFSESAPANLRVVREPQLGLTPARRRGFTEARAPLCVLVDDDNVLAPDYLAHVVRLFSEHPRVGALGGRSLPEFEVEPPDWAREFLPLLALRDSGDQPCISKGLRPPGAARNQYPAKAAPIGAGMGIRREAAAQWLAVSADTSLSDRRGGELTSGGDNDIVFTLLKHDWEVGYFPELMLAHLIPASRLTADYLARLNHGIQKSWPRVLAKYNACPWPPIAGWTVPLRQFKAWFTCRAWTSHAAHIRWRGACGQFEGRSQCSP